MIIKLICSVFSTELAFVLAMSFLVSPCSPELPPSVQYDFEDGTSQGLRTRPCSKAPDACSEVVSDPAIGAFALQYHIANLAERIESTVVDTIQMNLVHRFAFDVIFTDWGDCDKSIVFSQSGRAKGQPGSSPIFGLVARDDEVFFKQELDSPQQIKLWSAPIQTNVWYVFDVRVNYTTSQLGSVELRVNDNLVYSQYNARTLALGTTVGPSQRVGMYHVLGDGCSRNATFDNIKSEYLLN